MSKNSYKNIIFEIYVWKFLASLAIIAAIWQILHIMYRKIVWVDVVHNPYLYFPNTKSLRFPLTFVWIVVWQESCWILKEDWIWLDKIKDNWWIEWYWQFKLFYQVITQEWASFFSLESEFCFRHRKTEWELFDTELKAGILIFHFRESTCNYLLYMSIKIYLTQFEDWLGPQRAWLIRLSFWYFHHSGFSNELYQILSGTR